MKENTRGLRHSQKIKEEVDMYFKQVLGGVYQVTKNRSEDEGNYLTTSELVSYLNSKKKVAVEENDKVYANYDLTHHIDGDSFKAIPSLY